MTNRVLPSLFHTILRFTMTHLPKEVLARAADPAGYAFHAASASVASVLLLADLLIAARGKFFWPPFGSQWGEFLLGAFSYAAFVLALSGLVRNLLSRVLPSRSFFRFLSCSLGLLVPAALWTGLTSVHDAVHSPDFLLWGVLACIVAAAALSALLTWRPRTATPVCLSAIAGATAAIQAVLLVSRDVFLHEDRFQIVVGLAAANGILVFALCLVITLAHKRRLGAALAVAVLVLAVPQTVRPRWVSAFESEKATGPSVVLVMADALRADVCSVYGGPVSTPSLERLAREGTVFERTYSCAPWTIPSLSALFAAKHPPGLTPRLTPKERNEEEFKYYLLADYWLSGRSSLLPGSLRERGYRTIALIGNAAVAREDWLLREFDQVLGVCAANERFPVHLVHMPVLRASLARLLPWASQTSLLDSTRLLAEQTCEVLAQARGKPLFLWVHILDPHYPYAPPGDFVPEDSPIREFPPGPYDSAVSQTMNLRHPPDQTIPHIKRLYEGEVRYVDSALGRIHEAVRKHESHYGTYLIFSSDHGEELWEHGLGGHGHALYEEHLRVPLIIAGPDIKVQRRPEAVSMLSLMPTLCEILDVDNCEPCDAQSLASTLREGVLPPDGDLFVQATSSFTQHKEPQQAVISGRMKLIRGLVSGDVQVFDLEADPGETQNLRESDPETTRRLLDLIENWSQAVPVAVSDLMSPDTPVSDDTSEESLKETLKSLGYL